MNATKSPKPYKDADGIDSATKTLTACCNAVQELVSLNRRISTYTAREACAAFLFDNVEANVDDPLTALYAGMAIATLMRDRKVMFSDGANGPEIIDADIITLSR